MAVEAHDDCYGVLAVLTGVNDDAASTFSVTIVERYCVDFHEHLAWLRCGHFCFFEGQVRETVLAGHPLFDLGRHCCSKAVVKSR